VFQPAGKTFSGFTKTVRAQSNANAFPAKETPTLRESGRRRYKKDEHNKEGKGK